MEINLTGRTAMITGASKGLGLAIATRFAESGADVALLARRLDVLEEAKAIASARAKGHVAVFPCDVSRAADVVRAHVGVMERFGKIDILVNNAGESKAMPFAQITDELWQADLDLKLFAAIRTSRLVLEGMKARKWGRIINVLNIGAKAPRGGGAPTAVAHQGARQRICAPRRAGECAPCRADRQRSMGQAAPRAGTEHPVRGVHRQDERQQPGRPNGGGGGVRQHRLLSCLRRCLLHHRHCHQCRWWRVARGLRTGHQVAVDATPTRFAPALITTACSVGLTY